MKKILSIQDISCFGKCSQTAALPIISALGCECVCLPTAVLSAHTAFDGYYIRDLSQDIEAICDHWEKIGLSFDAIYTGYLANSEQVALAHHIIDRFGASIPVFVDPAMADNGKLYTGFTDGFSAAMATLCTRADYIMPNMTEACILSETPYRDGVCDMDSIKAIIEKLGARSTIITGVRFEKDEICTVYEKGGDIKVFKSAYLPCSYPGTGDVFAATIVGCAVRTGDIENAVNTAVNFTYECIRNTFSDKNYTYSVKFEECIPFLLYEAGLLPGRTS